MTTETPVTPDLTAIKARQQATWASGDYHVIGARIVLSSELLLESLDVHSTERVLDVATGSGNAALAAARPSAAYVLDPAGIAAEAATAAGRLGH